MMKLSHPRVCPYCRSGYLLENSREDPAAPEYQCNSCCVFATKWEWENLGKEDRDYVDQVPEEIKENFLKKGWSWGNLWGRPGSNGLFFSTGQHRLLLVPQDGRWKASWSYDKDQEFVSVEKDEPHKALKGLLLKIQDIFDGFPWDIT